MAYINQLPESLTIVDGYVHLEIIDPAEPTGYKSYKIKLEDFAGGTGSGGVETYANYAAFPVSGTVDILYIALDTYYSYVWNSGAYHQTSVLGDMILSAIQSVTGLKTFDKDKIAMKGTSTGINTVSVANTSASNYTNTIPAKDGTFAMTSDLVNAGYDATVGSSGDYVDLTAAQTAGKYKLKAVGNITVESNLSLNSNMVLDLNGFTMTMASYTIELNAFILKINCAGGLITITRSGVGSVFLGSDKLNTQLQIDSGILTLITSTSNISISRFGIFTGMTINMPNASYSGFGTETGNTGFYGIINNCNIVGGGSSCSNCIYEASAQFYCNIQNIVISGTFANSNIFALNTGVLKNIKYTSSSTCTLLASNIENFYDTSGRVTITCYAASTVPGEIKNVVCQAIKGVSYSRISNCVFLGASTIVTTNAQQNVNVSDSYFSSTLSITVVTGRDIHIHNCKIIGATTLDGDYFKFTNNICTGLLTLNSGSEYNLITGNTLTGGLTDNSTSATNIIKDNI